MTVSFQKLKMFFGHLISIIIGISFNQFLGISLGLSVELSVALMMYFKIIHSPAVANPLISLFAKDSYDFILFPVITDRGVFIYIIVFD